MDQNGINISYQAAMNAAGSLRGAASGIRNAAGREQREINDVLTENWAGSNADLFMQKVKGTKENLESCAANIEQIAGAIEETARLFRDTEMAKLSAENDSSEES
jgi:uncharacterized protein YukE